MTLLNAGFCLPLLLTLGLPLSAKAGQLTVDNPFDSGPGSLRQAIGMANAAMGKDEIVFTDGLGEIVLNSPIEIRDAISIVGGQMPQVLSGEGKTRLLIIAETAGLVELRNLDIRDGLAQGGQAINCEDWSGNGGAICSLSDLSITNSILQSNVAERSGGAIFVFNASLLINDSLIQNNQTLMDLASGGAISQLCSDCLSSPQPIFSTDSSTYRGNATLGLDADGSALAIDGPDVAINNSLFDGNEARGESAAGAIFARGNTTIRNSMAVNNRSKLSSCGVISFSPRITTTRLAIMDSTLYSNSAHSFGGALCAITIFRHPVALDIINSSIIANQAKQTGSAMLVSGITDIAINNSTITGNETAGQAGSGGTILLSFVNELIPRRHIFQLSSSILSGNTSPGGDIIDGSIEGDEYEILLNQNLLSNASNEEISDFEGNGNIFTDQPALVALGDNGCAIKLGFPEESTCVRTSMPVPHSPAVLQGSNPLDLPFDQRGEGFPRSSGLGTTIGAVSPIPASAFPTSYPVPTLNLKALVLLSLLVFIFCWKQETSLLK